MDYSCTLVADTRLCLDQYPWICRGWKSKIPLVARWPTLVNTTLLVPPFLFTISTLVLVGLSGRAYFRARAFCSDLLPADILLQIHNRAHRIPSDFIQANDLASPDLILTARRVAAAYLEVHRLVALNLIMFAVAAGVLWIPSCFYGLPNVASLIDREVAYKPWMSTLKSSCLEKNEAEYQLNHEADPAVVADVELGHGPSRPLVLANTIPKAAL